MIDIDHLLGLDTTDPANALELRRGIAELAGWTEVEEYRDGTWLGRNPMADNQLLPVIEYERSVDAALTLPFPDSVVFSIHLGQHRQLQDTALRICQAWLRYMRTRAQSAPVATADEEA